MAQAGFSCSIKMATGATTRTGIDLTDSGDGLRYHMTDPAHQPLDPTTALTVYDDGSLVDADDYEVNYLMGWVTFASTPSGAVTLDGASLDLNTIAEAKQYTATRTRALLDDTVFGDESMSRLPGLRDATLTLSQFASDYDDLDPGAGTTTLEQLLRNGTAKLVEVTYGAGIARLLRAFVRLESIETSAAPDALNEWSVSMVGALPGAARYAAFKGDPES